MGGMRRSTPCHPQPASSNGPVTREPAIAPRPITVEYTLIDLPARPAWALATTGTSTFPTAIPMPTRAIPANSVHTCPAGRSSVPRNIATMASSIARVGPPCRVSAGATKANTAKQSRGKVVVRPATPALSASSAEIVPSAGGSIVNGVRMRMAAMLMPMRGCSPR